jgi:hypothetical protein
MAALAFHGARKTRRHRVRRRITLAFSIGATLIASIRFAPDSPLEQGGFEPSVPLAKESVFLAVGEEPEK